MLSGLFVRRLVVPYLLLIVATGGAILVFASVRVAVVDDPALARVVDRESHALTLFTLGAVGVAAVVAAGIAYAYARVQAGEVRRLFAPLTPEAPKTGPASVGGLLEATAASVSLLMAQSAKDKAQLLTILSAMSDGLIAVDGLQRILLVNGAAEELLQFSATGAEGRPLYEVVHVTPLLNAVHEVMLTAGPKTFDLSLGPARHLEITLSRLPAADRDRSGLVIIARDVTESRRYEDLRKEFVANVSHELRTPLTMIKGFVETLRDGAIDDRARALQYLATVERHSDQLTNLVNDLLDLSRLESGADIPRSTLVYLEQTLHRVEELTAPAAAKKGHRLTFDVGPELPPVMGNADYLQRAISNLVDNAIKYTREGGHVAVSARRSGRQIAIEVKDDGIGIPPEDLSRIFERFYRVDRSRSREMGGTGLGLSIVKHVVQTHGGTVEVASTLGAGSTFTLRLPAASGGKA